MKEVKKPAYLVIGIGLITSAITAFKGDSDSLIIIALCLIYAISSIKLSEMANNR